MNHYTKIKNTYDSLLRWIIKNEGDDLHDLVIVYQDKNGETISFSWLSREERLSDRSGNPV